MDLIFNQRSRSGKILRPTLIAGEKITLPGASFKRCTSSRKSIAEVNTVSVPRSTPVAPSSSQRPAKWALMKNKSPPFLLLPCDPHIVQRGGKKIKCYLSHSLKHGQHPCPALSHCHRLGATASEFYYSPAEFPFNCRHKPADRATTPEPELWRHRHGIAEWDVGWGRPDWKSLDPEVERSVFGEKPGVVSTFPVTLPQREKSLLLGRPCCANKGKCFECLLIWQ